MPRVSSRSVMPRVSPKSVSQECLPKSVMSGVSRRLTLPPPSAAALKRLKALLQAWHQELVAEAPPSRHQFLRKYRRSCALLVAEALKQVEDKERPFGKAVSLTSSSNLCMAMRFGELCDGLARTRPPSVIIGPSASQAAPQAERSQGSQGSQGSWLSAGFALLGALRPNERLRRRFRGRRAEELRWDLSAPVWSEEALKYHGNTMGSFG
eukprot:s5713_g1.t1